MESHPIAVLFQNLSNRYFLSRLQQLYPYLLLSPNLRLQHVSLICLYPFIQGYNSLTFSLICLYLFIQGYNSLT